MEQAYIPEIDVIIPAYKPDQVFEKLILRLQSQTIRPKRIMVVNTEKALWDQAPIDKQAFLEGEEKEIRMELSHVSAQEFNHGGTRKAAAEQSKAEYLLFMTQDAMPEDTHLIEKLLQAIMADEKTGAAYARQLPAADCGFLERYTRSFNYPEESRLKSKEDIKELGIKTFFCSNVCAMYRKSIYDAVGGFAEHTIFNEDMICAGHMVAAGYKIAYAAEAKVIHSHNYNGIQQFKRNFDLAVSQVEFPEVFAGIKSESEGIRLVKSTMLYLVKQKKVQLIPKLIWQSGCKYIGYKMGRNYKKLPENMILFCTSNRNYWKQRK